MKHEGAKIFLDKQDVIRMNKLVRRQIAYDAFLEWHHSLQPAEQAELIGQLCHFAYQAGVNDAVFALASEKSGLSEADDFIILMKKVKGPGGLNFGGLAKWLCSVEPPLREKALKWFVFLFGVAEGIRRQNEKPENCNHWWHRNLEDERVVQSIMRDPKFTKTSPRDDEKLEL